MDSLDSNIFGDKKLKDIFQEIYNNQKKKERQISALIEELKPMVESIGDATLIVPLLKEYLEIGVKNDEQLIKMTTVIQRCLNTNNTGDGDGFGISEAEKTQLLNDINKLNDNSKE
jgi:hypothetical protein